MNVSKSGPRKDVSTSTRHFLIALAPAAIAGIWIRGDYVAMLALIGAAIVTSYAWSAVFARQRKRALDQNWLLHGVIFGLLLPPAMPLGLAALALSFGVVFGCHVFGGSGRYLVQPSLLAVVFIAFAYPEYLDTTAWLSGDSTGSAASALYPAACLLGALYLIATRRIVGAIVVGGLVSAFAAGTLLGGLSGYSQLLLGNFAFALTFIATDPTTQPTTTISRLVYGGLFGLLTVILRTFDPAQPEGTWPALLLAMLFIPLIDRLTQRPEAKAKLLPADGSEAPR